MFKDFSKANYLTLAGLILSIIVILFGNNFVQQWQKAKLYYSSQDVELQYPSFKKKYNDISDSTLRFYKEVRIINIKKTSANNLKLFITTNGDIKASKAFSIEDVFEARIDSGVMKVKLDRVVKGADIICQFWFITKPGTLSVKYLDNEGVRDISNISERDETNYFAIFGGIAIVIILIWTTYNYYFSPIIQGKKDLEDQNIELQLKYDSVLTELEEYRPIVQEDKDENVVDKLRKILDEHKNK